MDDTKGSVSATNLAVYHHLNCDLYLHNAFHRKKAVHPPPSLSKDRAGNALLQSHYKRGNDWETVLYSWLDESGLLLKVPSIPLQAAVLKENILADDREHFFISGLTFRPPKDFLSQRFSQHGSDPVPFGMAKPDLLEIRRTANGGVEWKVIDAKASKSVKTAHHVQIYFYSLCLQSLLPAPFFKTTASAGVWLPPEDGFNDVSPSFEDIKSIQLSLLSTSLDRFLFERLPKLVALPREEVKWHFNPLCSGCEYKAECRSVAIDEGRLGSAPNIAIGDSRTLGELLTLAEQWVPGFERNTSADIEDLHLLVSRNKYLSILEKQSPVTLKKAKAILALPRRQNTEKRKKLYSPRLSAVREQVIKIIPRRNFTCPSREDLAIVMSLIQDPATPKPSLEFFYITVYFAGQRDGSFSCSGSSDDFVATLAATIRNITSGLDTPPTAQFYVWSAGEQTILQAHLIKVALASDVDKADIRLCIGALAQGASWLQTTFQPVLLSGALLSFLGKGKRTRKEYEACLKRMGLSTQGNLSDLRARITDELKRLQGLDRARGTRSGRIPPVVVLKKEVERLLALPIPGYWDLRECYETLLEHPNATFVPADDDTLAAYRKDDGLQSLHRLLAFRNEAMYDVLCDMRQLIESSGLNLLVNEGQPVSNDFMDICHQGHLSKLFFMQQFEVFTRLNELWNSRIDGSPDAPVLEYESTQMGTRGAEHVFRLVSGAVDAPSDSDYTFYDKLLVEDQLSDTDIPVESLFDDLAIAGMMIPLNRWTKGSWDCQDRRVQDEVRLADIRNVYANAGATQVVLSTWGSSQLQFVPGRKYRLSPRLIDFNTSKVLATLFEMDWHWCEREENVQCKEDLDHREIPFLQLIMDPKSFGKVAREDDLLKAENSIQRLFKNLRDLDVPGANALLLKPSQHRATQRLLTNRLTVIWGPPGTGKTHTIALSLLRLLEVQWNLGDKTPKIIFVTAMTHAAINACLGKLEGLVAVYRSIPSLSTDWLDSIRIQRILRGNEHPGPSKLHTYVYAGTLFQLYNFSKAHNFEVDCLVADEAGQIALASLSLALRSLSPNGRIVVAGDSEQLAPIFAGSYPRLKDLSLFGSVLDSLMFTPTGSTPVTADSQDTEAEPIPPTLHTVVQLTENFRLNPDLGEFVSTIYSRSFKHQKVNVGQLGLILYELDSVDQSVGAGVSRTVFDAVRRFLIGLSEIMLDKPNPSILRNPSHRLQHSRYPVGKLGHYQVSLSLIRLKTWSDNADQFGYETHVHGEAAVAASLVACFRCCAPEEDIFVATPHRIQREAVKFALGRLETKERRESALDDAFAGMALEGHGTLTVDTIERLQGSEAGFVICLFSLPEAHSTDLAFLLERRRLNVAISRAKTLCILVASPQVLSPPVTVFANEQAAKGYAFLKAYEERAWSYDISVNVDKI